MPITKRQFELGINSEIEGWMRKIHQFLSDRRDQAFTREEVAEGVGLTLPFPFPPPPLPPLFAATHEPFDTALGKLLETGAVETRVVKERNYYRMGTRPLELILG